MNDEAKSGDMLQEQLTYLEALPLVQLAALLATPELIDDILDLAENSPVLQANIGRALLAEYEAMPEDERAELTSILEGIRGTTKHCQHLASRSAPIGTLKTIAQAVGQSISELLRSLLAISAAPVLAPAAAGTTSIGATLHQGGRVVLQIDQSGSGEFRGRFDYPATVVVNVFDPSTGGLRAFEGPEARISTEALLHSGRSRMRVRLHDVGGKPESLILVVRRQKELRS